MGTFGKKIWIFIWLWKIFRENGYLFKTNKFLNEREIDVNRSKWGDFDFLLSVFKIDLFIYLFNFMSIH